MFKKGQIHLQGEIFIDGVKAIINREIRKDDYQNAYHHQQYAHYQNQDLDLKGTTIHVTTSQVRFKHLEIPLDVGEYFIF